MQVFVKTLRELKNIRFSEFTTIVCQETNREYILQPDRSDLTPDDGDVVLPVQGGDWRLVSQTGGSGGVTNFRALTDTPSSYTSYGGQFVRVRSDESGLEFAAGGGASEFTDLTDTPASYTTHGGKVVRVRTDETGLEFATPSSGASDFTSLTDTPASYSTHGGKLVRVRTDETGLEFTTAGAGASDFTSLTDTPSSYTSHGGKTVRVRGDETGLEFVTASASPYPQNVTVLTTSTTLTSAEQGIVIVNAPGLTVTLPSSPVVGTTFIFVTFHEYTLDPAGRYVSVYNRSTSFNPARNILELIAVDVGFGVIWGVRTHGEIPGYDTTRNYIKGDLIESFGDVYMSVYDGHAAGALESRDYWRILGAQQPVSAPASTVSSFLDPRAPAIERGDSFATLVSAQVLIPPASGAAFSGAEIQIRPVSGTTWEPVTRFTTYATHASSITLIAIVPHDHSYQVVDLSPSSAGLIDWVYEQVLKF